MVIMEEQQSGLVTISLTGSGGQTTLRVRFLMSSLIQHAPAEVSYALRTLRRSPMYTGAAVATLALGIGANALVYCFASALFLRPLPFKDAHELVGISTTFRAASGDIADFAPSALDLVAYKNRARTLASVGGIDSQTYAIMGRERAESVLGATVTASLWDVLGTRAAAGRTFGAREDRADSHVVVISDALQRRLFPGPGDAALGRSLIVDGQPREVIGVMPPSYRPRMNPGELWIPMGVTETTAVQGQKMQVVARLKPGATIEMATADLTRLAAELAVELPDNHRDWGVSVKGLREKIGHSARAVTATLVAAVAFLLLLTCANVTNLALVRAAHREADVATRLALGASKASILRHQVLEALIVSVVGGALGALLAAVGLRSALRLMTADNPLVSTVSLDARVMMMIGLVAIAVGLACSVAPGRHSVRGALASALVGGARQPQPGRKEARLRRGLMSLQVAVAAVLVVASSSAVMALRDVQEHDVGFAPEDVYIASVTLPVAGYPTLLKRSMFVEQVLGRLRETPGIKTASIVTHRFLPGRSVQSMVTIDGQEAVAPVATELRRIDADYFAALSIPVLQGRGFNHADRDGSLPVAIVNGALVRQYLRGRDPLTARIKRRVGPWLQVVGVVPDVSDSGLGVNVGPMLYLPFAQAAAASVSFVVKSGLGPAPVERAVRVAITSVDPGQPLDEVAPLSKLLDDSLGERRFKSLTLALLSLLGLLVACLGLYGVTAYALTRRKQEVAIRMALGAPPSRIVRAFLLESGRFIAAGASCGLLLAFTLGRVLQRWAPEVGIASLGTYVATGFLLVLVGLAATLAPTLQASRTAPARVLRGD